MQIDDDLDKRLQDIWQKPDFNSFFKIYSKSKSHLVKKGTVIFNEGDSLERLYFIKEGFVKLYRLSDQGRETTIYLYGPGNILGIRALTSKDECAKHYAEAITDLQIITLSRKEYMQILREHPEYIVDLLHVFINRLNYTERKLEGFIITDTTARVAYFLTDCAERFGKVKDGNFEIPLTLTHQRIAEFVGSFRETVTLALQKLENEAALKNARGKIIILDLKKLQRFSQNGEKN